MKIISWNVNSIKARLEHAIHYLKTTSPDFAFFQELKGEEFPHAEFLSIGYKAIASGQKSYNGVAILYRADLHGEIEIINDALAGDETDLEKRYLEIRYQNINLINIYLPNGNPVSDESTKFPYKLKWMDRLINRVRTLRNARTDFIIGGDFNIIPEDIDCFDPALWRGDALFHPQSLAKFRTLMACGLTDAFRVFNNTAEQYSFWDYQAGCWQKNQGIRIDHFLCSPAITDRLKACTIDKAPRALEKPSDHTPIWVEVG